MNRDANAANTRGSPAGRLVLAAAVLGNALEFYDFVIYSFFAVYIGRAFFPTNSKLASLLLSVATFGIGFVTRPIGGVVIGAYADRAGRKPALLLTFALMSVGTLAIVVTPGYATIGPAAPLILVAARLVQGMALGGEVGPSTALLLESAPLGRRGLYTSFQGASQGAASLASGVVGLVLSCALRADQLAGWGWRIAFALGLLLVPVGMYVRHRLPERHAAGVHGGADVLRIMWQVHRTKILLSTLVVMSMTIGTYVAAYMTTYALTTLGLPARMAMLAPIVVGALTMAMSMWAGGASDRYNRRRLMIGSRVATMVAVYPLFAWLVYVRSAGALVCVMAALTLLGVPGGAAAVAMMSEIFPREVRSSGLSITYALAVTLFGGTTQFVVVWLLGVTHNPLSPAWYVIASSAVSVMAMLMLPRSIERSTTDPASDTIQ